MSESSECIRSKYRMDQGAPGRHQRRPFERAQAALAPPVVHTLPEAEEQSEAGSFEVVAPPEPTFLALRPAPPPVTTWPILDPGTAVLLFTEPTTLVCACKVCESPHITHSSAIGIHLNRRSAEGTEDVWAFIRSCVEGNSPWVIICPARQAVSTFIWNAWRHAGGAPADSGPSQRSLD